jgi:isocitrate dehydrogenase (NAD+)
LDLIVVRENTEDLYAGIEFEQGSPETAALREELRRDVGYELREDAGVTIKPISVTGTRRIVQFAFDHARRNGRRKVTLGHKANIMKFSDGLFLRTAAAEATAYPEIELEPVQIDELAMRLAWEPDTFDVLLLPNLYGDIVSDLAAGLTGGLGLASGANLGWEYALFEPVHGSAPDIAGKGLADPVAMIFSAAMLLRHVAERAAADAVERAVVGVLAEGAHLTPDLGGTATTMEMAGAIADAAANARSRAP